jgi:hypothetical protein
LWHQPILICISATYIISLGEKGCIEMRAAQREVLLSKALDGIIAT